MTFARSCCLVLYIMLPTVISAHVNSRFTGYFPAGIEQSFDFEDEVKNDPYRVDTVKIGTFTIPVCSYGQPNAKVHLTLECSISRMESGRYNREMYLDCLYFKPNREE